MHQFRKTCSKQGGSCSEKGKGIMVSKKVIAEVLGNWDLQDENYGLRITLRFAD